MSVKIGNLVESVIRFFGVKAKQGCGCDKRKEWLNGLPWTLIFTFIRFWNGRRHGRKLPSRKHLAKNPHLLLAKQTPEREAYAARLLTEQSRAGKVRETMYANPLSNKRQTLPIRKEVPSQVQERRQVAQTLRTMRPSQGSRQSHNR